jgi:hypothetical protein
MNMASSLVHDHTIDENLETFSLLWLDAQMDNNKRNRHAQKQLRTIINQFKTIEDENECQHFIEQTSKEDRLVLIISDQLGRLVVPRIHCVRQVSSIYVYCLNKQANYEWANNFPKVRSFSASI